VEGVGEMTYFKDAASDLEDFVLILRNPSSMFSYPLFSSKVIQIKELKYYGIEPEFNSR